MISLIWWRAVQCVFVQQQLTFFPNDELINPNSTQSPDESHGMMSLWNTQTFFYYTLLHSSQVWKLAQKEDAFWHSLLEASRHHDRGFCSVIIHDLFFKQTKHVKQHIPFWSESEVSVCARKEQNNNNEVGMIQIINQNYYRSNSNSFFPFSSQKYQPVVQIKCQEQLRFCQCAYIRRQWR